MSHFGAIFFSKLPLEYVLRLEVNLQYDNVKDCSSFSMNYYLHMIVYTCLYLIQDNLTPALVSQCTRDDEGLCSDPVLKSLSLNAINYLHAYASQ